MASTLLTGISAYYPCDDNSSTQPDSVGSNDATLVGNMVYTASGKINGGVDGANGSGDYLSIPSAAFNVDETTDYTISLWLYPTLTTSRNSPFNMSADSNVYGIACNIDLGTNDTVVWAGQEAGNTYWSITTTAHLTQDAWNHLVVIQDVDDTGKTYIFINGVLRGVATISTAGGASGLSTSDIEIGRSHASYYYRGSADEVGLWTKALTHSTTTLGDTATGEVAELYNSGDGLSYPFSAGSGWTGKINGVTNPSKVNGQAVANITTINGQ